MRWLLLGVTVLAACGSAQEMASRIDGGTIVLDETQLPPTEGTELETWLSAGHYKQWKCEPAPHPPRALGAHHWNRICSNSALSGSETTEFPVGAASVKELWDSDGKNVTGFAVSRRVKPGADGASWFWYERTGLRVVTEGTGDLPGPQNICVGCHIAAGSDESHSGRDFVFTQVR